MYSMTSYYCTYCGVWVNSSECDEMGKIKHNLCGHFVRTRPYRSKEYSRRRRGYPRVDGRKRDSLGRFIK